jgi:hypothetical protein
VQQLESCQRQELSSFIALFVKRLKNQPTGDSSASRVVVLSQNVQGLKKEAKLETIIQIIEERKVYSYCVQEI